MINKILLVALLGASAFAQANDQGRQHSRAPSAAMRVHRSVARIR